MKKRTIAIIAGGDSSELPVSLRSAQGIYSFIDKEKYNLYIVEMQGQRWEVVLPSGEKTPIDRNDFSFTENGEKKNFDFAYITIHGTPGENGILQGYFDLIGMPYSSCNVLVSAMTLGFVHPRTGEEMFFTSPLAADMVELIGKWRTYISNREL